MAVTVDAKAPRARAKAGASMADILEWIRGCDHATDDG